MSHITLNHGFVESLARPNWKKCNSIAWPVSHTLNNHTLTRLIYLILKNNSGPIPIGSFTLSCPEENLTNCVHAFLINSMFS